jgi:LPXTG-motif cell wall-anchored protein
MRRIVTTAVLATALLGLGAGPASAEDTPALIEAVPQHVALDQNPWSPTGDLAVTVKNHGPGAADGHFLLHLPSGVAIGGGTGCQRADGPHQPAYICGGKSLAVGATTTYRVELRSTNAEPVFGVRVDGGWVEGKNLRGAHGKREAFAVRWPEKLPVRLAATASPRTDGHVDIAVRVTNAGRTTLGGYSLNVLTPAGVTVVSPACSDSGRTNGVGCEVYRSRPVLAGTTDAFTLRIAADDTARSVRLVLAPGNRYPNSDTQVTLGLGGTAILAAAGQGGSVPELPLTGPSSGIPLTVGAVLALAGAGVCVRRRTRFSVA